MNDCANPQLSAAASVLIVDDHRAMAEGLADYLADHGYYAHVATSGQEALDAFRSCPYDAVITDLRMQGMDGLSLLDAIRRIDSAVPVLVMTGFGSIENAVEAVQRGAFHYFSKPLQSHEVRAYLARAVEHRMLAQSRDRLLRETRDRYGFESMVGRSASMRRIFDLIERVSDSNASVLITGESGTGKELIARAVHYRGARADKAFVPINCAAIPATLLESELFGYEKGAFTGAHKARPGLVTEASSGTLFLDEIGDMPVELQPKLLRLLQEGEVRPVGADAVRQVDVRVVAATNANLEALVNDGRFRRDLYYRLNVVPIEVPPLRERTEDILPLTERLLEKLGATHPRLRGRKLSAAAMERLMVYPWPGNVRELENVLERAATLCVGDSIVADDLRFLDRAAHKIDVSPAAGDWPSLRDMEQRYIQQVLEHVGGSKVRAAAILGVDPSTLYRRVKSKNGSDL